MAKYTIIIEKDEAGWYQKYLSFPAATLRLRLQKSWSKKPKRQ